MNVIPTRQVTLPYYLGDTLPVPIRLLQLDRVPYDLSDCRVWLEINARLQIITLYGAVPDPLAGIVEFDFDGIELPYNNFVSRVGQTHKALLRIEWSNGAVETIREVTVFVMGSRND